MPQSYLEQVLFTNQVSFFAFAIGAMLRGCSN
ncbi:Uncharacterised protein [Vibrio cholerae]|nr:Uncharacterised protein [Vibrio cholerae]